MNNIDKIKSIIGFTWFDISNNGDDILIDTRANGDVGEGETGREDRIEGRRIVKALSDNAIKSDLEFVDEWVIVTVR